jgi:hypothetical protein
MRKLILLSLMLVSLGLAPATLSQTIGPQNLQFQAGELGQVPTGWFGNMPGYTARLTAEGVSTGKRAVEIAGAAQPPSQFGLLRINFNAAPYRGKKIRFRAAVRVEGSTPEDRAQLWLRVDLQQGMGFFDNMGDRPIRTRDWQYFDIVGDVANDAEQIFLGMMLIQKGKAWISDATFDVLGDARSTVVEPGRPMTSRELRNEVVFARLFGYLRYFHPSDEAARTDWEALAIRGVRDVEAAKDDAELTQKLMALFQPVSPTLRIGGAGQQYTPPAALNTPGSNPRITYWKHFGLGPTTGDARMNVYRSERVQESAGSPTEPRLTGLTPNSPFRADLGDGLTAWVPLSLYVDNQGTLPHTATAITRETDRSWSANSRGVRIADVVLAWNVFEHFYPYFDVVGTDWMAQLPDFLQQAASDQGEAAFTATLRRMVAALHDGHGAVNKAESRGLLPLQWEWVENNLTITAVGPSVTGVSIGDTVLTINGRASSAALAASEELISGATPQWIRYRALQDLLTGAANANADLDVASAREPGKVTRVALRYGPPPVPAERRPDKIAELENGIFYVDIGRISEADFNGALPRLSNARGIIFDFRGYPSLPPTFLTHLTDQRMTSAQWHVPSVTLPDRQNLQFIREGEWNMPAVAPFLSAKKVFITDGRAISYAESCLGIIENYKLGEIVGAPSAGTNGNVNPFGLPGGYTITWTGMKVLKHDGSQHHGIGIKPTIPVSRTRAGIAAGRDEFLERAILAVKG